MPGFSLKTPRNERGCWIYPAPSDAAIRIRNVIADSNAHTRSHLLVWCCRLFRVIQGSIEIRAVEALQQGLDRPIRIDDVIHWLIFGLVP